MIKKFLYFSLKCFIFLKIFLIVKCKSRIGLIEVKTTYTNDFSLIDIKIWTKYWLFIKADDKLISPPRSEEMKDWLKHLRDSCPV